MNKSSLIFATIITGLFLTQACAFKDNYTVDNPFPTRESLNIPLTRSDYSIDRPTNNIKSRVITAEALDDILSKSLRNTSIKNVKSYSLKTISENDCPIIHSVNFDNGGWALVAGREIPENQIIAFGEEGSFDPDNIDSPEVRFWLNITKRSLINFFEQADRETSDFQEGMASVTEEEEEFADSFSFNDPYVWVRLYIGTEDSTAYYHKGHLTQTQWGQLSPWNYKCPSINGEKCPTGCSTVAVAQMLYYLHYNLGKPSGLYHTIDTSFTWNSGGYFVSNLTRSNYNSPSSRWDAMAISSIDCYIHNSSYGGDLMIDVANLLGTKFKPGDSEAPVTTDVFQDFNISCSKLSYNSAQVITSLDNSMPVVVRGADTTSRSNMNGEGHAWLIDGYRKEVTLHKHQYKWVIMPPDSLSFYNNINYDYVFTDSEMQRYYPDIEENEIVYTYTASAPSYLFRMNWGWDGSYNYGLYSILPSGWDPGYNPPFDYDTQMFINFTAL